MPESRSLSLAEDRSYDLIERAMMESARGRRFLAEFVRRHRNADTSRLLDAMGRLEHAVTRDHARTETGHDGPAEVAWADPRDRSGAAETASGRAPESVPGSGSALEPLAPAVRRASAEMLGEAEALQETAWRLRESGAAAKLCAELDQCATRIYAACSSQEALAQRTERAAETLRGLEERIAALDAKRDRTSGPAALRRDRADDRHPGSDADRLSALARRFQPHPAGAEANAIPSLDDLDRLSIEERLALFS